MKRYDWRREREKFQTWKAGNDAGVETPATPQPLGKKPLEKRSMPLWTTSLFLFAISVVGVIVYEQYKASCQKEDSLKNGERILSKGEAQEPLPNEQGKPEKPIIPTSEMPEQPPEQESEPINTENIGNVDHPHSALSNFSDIAEKFHDAVGVVIVTGVNKDGKICPIPIGTAWANSKTSFITNAHVVMALKETAEILHKKKYSDKIIVFILLNRKKGLFKKVEAVQIHEDYGSTAWANDLGALIIQGETDKVFKIASEKKLQSLKAGIPVAYLGFPMENTINMNLNMENPVATLQTGIVIAMSDFTLKDAGQQNNYLIRHNLPNPGGSSGSPIFDMDGEIIGINNSGNVDYIFVPRYDKDGNQVKDEKGNPIFDKKRIDSAAMINFGQRADLLPGLGKKILIKEFIEPQANGDTKKTELVDADQIVSSKRVFESDEEKMTYSLFQRVNQQRVESAKLFAELAKHGHPLGTYFYALALLNGDGVQQNQTQAIVNLRNAAARGLPEAAAMLKQLNAAGHNQISNR